MTRSGSVEGEQLRLDTAERTFQAALTGSLVTDYREVDRSITLARVAQDI